MSVDPSPWEVLRAKLRAWGVKVAPWRTTDAALDGDSRVGELARKGKEPRTFLGFKLTWRF
jgi:hypothetical protein